MNKRILDMLKMFGLNLAIRYVEGEGEGGSDDDDKNNNKGKAPEPTVAELQTKLAEFEKQLADKDKHIQRGDGLLNELKNVRSELQMTKQQLAEKVKDKADELGIDLPGDDEYIQGKDLKKIVDAIKKDAKKQVDDTVKGFMSLRAKERLADDEDRMADKKLDIPYNDAMEKFKELAEDDATLWDQVNRESHRPGGKPAQLAYKIALRDHPDLAKKLNQKTRDELIDEITKTGKMPAKLSGGGRSGKLDPKNLTQEDIYKMSDKELDDLSREL
uniref:Uncharacterized protein n=1 Tax=viral metagenome TaxID=1070528 RepID=A0A6M3L5I4_9ZZZZ